MDTNREQSAGHVHNPEAMHETSDVNVRGIVGFGAGLVVCTILICLLLIGMFNFLRAEWTPKPINPSPLLGVREPLAPEKTPRVFPEPRLQVNYFEDLDKVRGDWNEELNSYGWADKNNGVVHIPIDKAIELTLQRGLPARGTEMQEPVDVGKK